MESLFRVGDIPGTEVLMLPLGYTLAVFLNCIFLWLGLNKKFHGFSHALFKTLLHTFSASVIMGLVSYIGLNIFHKIFNLETLFGIFMQGLLSGILGILFYIFTLKLLKSHELKEIWSTLHNKIWKAKPLPADITEM